MKSEEHEINAITVTAQGHSGNILDAPTEQFAEALERRGKNRDLLIKWIRDDMVEDVDFGKIKIGGRKSKPSLFKPGAQKICGKLGVIAHFPSLNDYEQKVLDGGVIDNIILKCELTNASGDIMATGVGARSVEKERGDLNKALKMAKKSAMIDATLDLGGLSEVFTQDIEDMNLTSNSVEMEWSETTREKPLHFTKEKGTPWKEVDKGLLHWLEEHANDDWVQQFAMHEIEYRDEKGSVEQAVADEVEVNGRPDVEAETVKSFPDDYSKIECINLINGKLNEKYSQLFGKGAFQEQYKQKLGDAGMTAHQKESLVKFIQALGDEIRIELNSKKEEKQDGKRSEENS